MRRKRSRLFVIPYYQFFFQRILSVIRSNFYYDQFIRQIYLAGRKDTQINWRDSIIRSPSIDVLVREKYKYKKNRWMDDTVSIIRLRRWE